MGTRLKLVGVAALAGVGLTQMSLVPALASSTSGTGTSTVVVVPASIPADCSRPVDSQVNAWLLTVPDGDTARFAKDGCYAQDGSLIVDKRHGLVIDGNGSTFRAVTQGGPDRVNWYLGADDSITIENMTVLGANPRAGIPYHSISALQWQHGIELASTHGALVDNVVILDTFGDLLEARGDHSGKPSEDIIVENSNFKGSGRNGLGLTNVDGFTFTDSYLGNIPRAGIDMEPDATDYGRNITISHNTFGNSHFEFFATAGQASALLVGDITIADNTMTGPLTKHDESCDPIILVIPYENQVLSGYTITGNHFLGYGDMVSLTDVAGSSVTGNFMHFEDGGCRNTVGVSLTDSDATVAANIYSGRVHPAEDVVTAVPG